MISVQLDCTLGIIFADCGLIEVQITYNPTHCQEMCVPYGVKASTDVGITCHVDVSRKVLRTTYRLL